jgi:hypothetical protein
MRAWELLESVDSEFESDLEDLLIVAKANELTEVEVDDLVDQLSAMGHSVTADSLVSAIESQDLEFIKNATLNTITFNDHIVQGDEGDYDDIPVDAERLATRTAMKDVKKGKQQKQKAAKDAQL